MGAGNASQALSEMTGHKIEVEFPEIEQRDITEIPEMLGRREKVFTNVKVDVGVLEDESNEKENLGTLMLILRHDSAKKLGKYLVEEEDRAESEEGELTSQEESALKETGNILTGACLAAITEWVDLRLREGIPDLHTDMLGATVDGVLLEMARENDEALVFRTEFNFKEELDAYFLFLFKPKGREMILDRLAV